MTLSPLRLLHGGRSPWYRVNGFNCRLVSTATFRSLPLDAVVYEEDTHLILTLDRVMRHQEVHPIRLMTELHASRPHRPGTLIVNDTSWYGVVIDLDLDQVWNPKCIRMVYEEVGRRINLRRVENIGVHLLGTIHGRMDEEACLKLFVSAVGHWRCKNLSNVWLIVSERSRLTTDRLAKAYGGELW